MNRPIPPQHEDLASHALGALDRGAAAEATALIATSAEARREFIALQEVAALLAAAAPAPAADTRLRERVLERIKHEKSQEIPVLPVPVPPRTRGGFGGVWIALAASLAGILVLGTKVYNLSHVLTDRDAVIKQQAAELARGKVRLNEQEAILKSMMDPAVQMVHLTATADAKPGIQLFWNRAKGMVMLHAYSLKPAAAGRTYQLWFIKNGKPMPSATFNPGADGEAMVAQIEAPPPEGVTLAAITEEPMGGSTLPTTAPFMTGVIAAQ